MNKKMHKQSCAVEQSGCSWAQAKIWHLEIVFEFLTEVLSHWVQICRVLMKIVCLTNMSANNQRTWKAKSLMSSAPKHIEILMICSDALSVGKLQQFDDTCLQTRQVQKRFHLSMTLPKNTSLISEPSSHHWVLKNMKQQSPKDWNMTWTAKNNKAERKSKWESHAKKFPNILSPTFHHTKEWQVSNSVQPDTCHSIRSRTKSCRMTAKCMLLLALTSKSFLASAAQRIKQMHSSRQQQLFFLLQSFSCMCKP